MSSQNVGQPDVQDLIDALNAKLDLQEKQIQAQAERIRRLESSRNWYHHRPVIGLLVIIIFVLLIGDGRFALAQSGSDQSNEPSAVTGNDQPILVANNHAPTTARSFPTRIGISTGFELSPNLFLINNYATNPISQPANTRIAIVGATSGFDINSDTGQNTGYKRAGVLGIVDNTPGAGVSQGYGVWGKATGFAAIGVYGHSQDYIGVYGVSENSTALQGMSTDGFAVLGSSENSTGVYGSSMNYYGAVFQGGRAPLQLTPADTAGAPSAGDHEMGELYVDSEGNLFFCTQDGTPGKWIKLNGSAVYLPTITK